MIRHLVAATIQRADTGSGRSPSLATRPATSAARSTHYGGFFAKIVYSDEYRFQVGQFLSDDKIPMKPLLNISKFCKKISQVHQLMEARKMYQRSTNFTYWGRLPLAFLLIFGGSIASAAELDLRIETPASATYNCSDDVLDINFSTADPWANAEDSKSFSHPFRTWLVEGDPKLDYTSSSGFLLDGPSERFRFLPTIGAETVTSFCLRGVQVPVAKDGSKPPTIGALKITYIKTTEEGDIVYSPNNDINNNPDPDCEGVPAGLPCTKTTELPIYTKDSNELMLKIVGTVPLVTSAQFSVSGSKIEYGVYGIIFTEGSKVTCVAGETKCSVTEGENLPRDILNNKYGRTLTAGATTGWLNYSGDNLSNFNAEYRAEEVINFPDDREQCEPDQASPVPGLTLVETECTAYQYEDPTTEQIIDLFEPYGLLMLHEWTSENGMDHEGVSTLKRCSPPDPDDAIWSQLHLDERDWSYVTPEYCGMKTKEGRFFTNVKIISRYQGYNGQEIEVKTEAFHVEDDGTPSGSVRACTVSETDPVALYSFRKEREEREFSGDDAVTVMAAPEVPTLETLPDGVQYASFDMGVGCARLRGSGPSILTRNAEPSPYYDRHEAFEQLTRMLNALVEQADSCSTNGNVTSIIKSYIGDYTKWYERGDGNRTLQGLSDLLFELKRSQTVDYFSHSGWDLSKTAQWNIENPVCLAPEDDSSIEDELVPSLALGMAKLTARSQQYKICRLFADYFPDDSWRDDPTHICQCFLSENAPQNNDGDIPSQCL